MGILSDEEYATIPASSRVLELGCGPQKRVPHSTTLDINPKSVADVIHDLNAFPYPFPDNTFDVIIAEHVLEHLNDLIRVYEELHRIARPGGILYVETPHFSSSNFYTDPTHKHAFTTRSFDYFVEGTPLSRFHYSPIRFRKRRVTISYGGGSPLARALGRWINGHQQLYEQRLAFILPKDNVRFELEVVKEEPL